jgi:hypothetical protein
MTEENARKEYLKENTKIDASAYLAIQEIEYLIKAVILIQRNLRDNNRSLKDDNLKDLTMLEPYNYSKSFVDAVVKAWELTFGKIEVALEIFKAASGLQNIDPPAMAIMRDAILKDIEANPIDWMNVPRISTLAALYMTSSEKA